jgi:hypothetical protein
VLQQGNFCTKAVSMQGKLVRGRDPVQGMGISVGMQNKPVYTGFG